MARGVPRFSCRVCDRHVDECGPLSARGKCFDCADRRVTENITQLHEHNGAALLRWRRGLVACAGGILIEDIPAYLDSLRETG